MTEEAMLTVVDDSQLRRLGEPLPADFVSAATKNCQLPTKSNKEAHLLCLGQATEERSCFLNLRRYHRTPNDEVERRGGGAQRQTKALYPNHRLPSWLTED